MRYLGVAYLASLPMNVRKCTPPQHRHLTPPHSSPFQHPILVLHRKKGPVRGAAAFSWWFPASLIPCLYFNSVTWHLRTVQAWQSGMSLNVFLSKVSSESGSDDAFWAGIPQMRSNVLFVLMPLSDGQFEFSLLQVILIYYLVKVVSARIPQCKVVHILTIIYFDAEIVTIEQVLWVLPNFWHKKIFYACQLHIQMNTTHKKRINMDYGNV